MSSLRRRWSTGRFEKVLDPYDNHSLGEVHVRLAGTDAAETMRYFQDRAEQLTEQMIADTLAEVPEISWWTITCSPIVPFAPPTIRSICAVGAWALPG